jgi:hypothetical protein
MAAALHLFAVSDSANNFKLISLKWLHDEQNCDVQKRFCWNQNTAAETNMTTPTNWHAQISRFNCRRVLDKKRDLPLLRSDMQRVPRLLVNIAASVASLSSGRDNPPASASIRK